VNPEGLVAAPEAEALWEVVVEQGLIPSSHERKYLAFELFARLLPYLPEARAAAVFSRGFMQCLVNNLAGKENYLHRRATQCAHTIVQYVALPSTGPRARVAVTTALQRFAGGRFDQLTGTQTVVKLLAAQDASSAGQH
jgi:DNA polymerase phi